MQARAGQPTQVSQAPAPVTATGIGQGGADVVVSGADPSQVYEGYRHQRSELADQLERLEDQRGDISGKLQDPQLNDVDRKGLEQRITTLDQRISATEAQLAIADANVAKAAAIPGAVVIPKPIPRPGPPDEVYVLSGIFMFVVLLPLSIAYARRIWRRGAQIVTQIPQEMYERFSRLDQSVDAIAIEVERIGEGQRYLTRLYGDQPRPLGAGAAEHVELPVREKERQK